MHCLILKGKGSNKQWNVVFRRSTSHWKTIPQRFGWRLSVRWGTPLLPVAGLELEKLRFLHFGCVFFDGIFIDFCMIVVLCFHAVLQHVSGIKLSWFWQHVWLRVYMSCNCFCACIRIARKLDVGYPYNGYHWFRLLECSPKYDKLSGQSSQKTVSNKNTEIMLNAFS